MNLCDDEFFFYSYYHILTTIHTSSVAEPEPHHLVGGRARTEAVTWLGSGGSHKMIQFITHSVHVFSNINRTESNEKDNFNMCLNFSYF
jgi:hypothetical protein